VEIRRWGLLVKSFYISEEIPQAKTIADYWREDLLPLKGIEGRTKRRATLRSLAYLFKALHERGIYHNDLKASNILAVDRGPTSDAIFSLIDLQGVRKCFYLSKRRRIKNLAQINRTLGRQLSRTEKLFFIKAYHGDAIVDRIEKRQLLRNILTATHRQVIRERARHLTTEGAPYRDGLYEMGELAADEYARSKALSM
jgi:serine/threonine protein kinase